MDYIKVVSNEMKQLREILRMFGVEMSVFDQQQSINDDYDILYQASKINQADFQVNLLPENRNKKISEHPDGGTLNSNFVNSQNYVNHSTLNFEEQDFQSNEVSIRMDNRSPMHGGRYHAAE